MRMPGVRWALRALVLALIPILSPSADAGPAFGAVYCTPSPRVNNRCELTFTLANILPHGEVFPGDPDCGYNPFWMDTTTSSPLQTAPGVKVWASIRGPDGLTFTIEGFWCVEYEYLGDSQSGYDRIVPINHPQTGTAEHWHVRFIPKLAGSYTATIYANDPDPSTSAVSTVKTFTVAASEDKGILKVSSNGQCLEHCDGSPFCQFGFAMQQGCPPVAHWPVLNGKKGLEVFADAGGNFIRRWIVNTAREDIYRGISWHRASGEEYDDITVHKGSYSRRIAGDPSTRVVCDRSFLGCRGLRTYTASIWVRAATGAVGRARVCVKESNGTSTVLHYSDWLTASESWQQVTLSVNTASDAKWLHFQPELAGGSSGLFYFDDMDLRDTTPGSAVDFNMIQNPSFEDWSPVQLDVANLWRTEYCLRKCENLGIKVQLCLFDYRLWNSIDPLGFYYTWFGGGFWGDMSTGTWKETDAVKQQKRVMRYLAARYGGYPSLGLWEMTNEVSPWHDDTRYNWLKNMSKYLQMTDKSYGGIPNQRPVTNSTWFSPADSIAYEQVPNMPVSSVHSYIYTNTHPTLKNRVPGWGMDATALDTSSFVSPPKAYHVALTWPSEVDEDTLVGRSFGIHPGKRYKITYFVKLGAMTGSNPRLRAQYIRHDINMTTIADESQYTTGPTNWVAKQMNWTAGPNDAKVSIRFQVTDTLSAEVWLDDMCLYESDDGVTWKQIIPNSDLSISNLGDDEIIWALNDWYRCREHYMSGPSGFDKIWLSGENGLFQWSAEQNTWVFGQLGLSDTTGIHTHNSVWAQVMATGAKSSPCYWFSGEYMVDMAEAGIDVYSPTWKGVSEFVKILPFRSGSQLLTCQSFFSQITGVTSTDPRIRLIGQKKDNTAYFWVSNSTNTWANRVQRGQPAVPVSATLSIPGFVPGTYILKNYNAYIGAYVSQNIITASGDGRLRVQISDLATDTAYIVAPSSPGELHPLFMPDGTVVNIEGFIVSSAPNDEPKVYMQDPSRAWGIRVEIPEWIWVQRGEILTVRGALRTLNGERYVEVVAFEDISRLGYLPEPDPIYIPNRALGGSAPGQFTPQIKDGVGLYNVGLLVQCMGRVTYMDQSYLYMDDGAGVSDGAGHVGIRLEISGIPWWVELGDVLSVTGLSSTAMVNGQVVRTIKPRFSWDIMGVYGEY